MCVVGVEREKEHRGQQRRAAEGWVTEMNASLHQRAWPRHLFPFLILGLWALFSTAIWWPRL